MSGICQLHIFKFSQVSHIFTREVADKDVVATDSVIDLLPPHTFSFSTLSYRVNFVQSTLVWGPYMSGQGQMSGWPLVHVVFCPGGPHVRVTFVRVEN